MGLFKAIVKIATAPIRVTADLVEDVAKETKEILKEITNDED